MGKGLRAVVSGALVMTLSSFASVSLAQVQESKSQDGYGYRFDDDPLSAGGFSSGELTIRLNPKAAKQTLIRPRASFVAEMLKSVEHL